MLTHFENKYFTWFKQKLSLANNNIVALQFAASDIVIIMIANTSTGQEITELYRLDLPDDLKNYIWLDDKEYLASYIQANTNYRLFDRAQAVAVIDSAKTCLKELNMPLLSAVELEQAVKWDALQHLPYEDGEYTYGYLSDKWENSDGEGLKISLIATEKRISQAIQLVCLQLKLQLKQITTTALALSELINTDCFNWAILDIGLANSQIYFFSGKRPVYQASINLGKAEFINVLSDNLELSAAQAAHLLDDYHALNKLLAKSQLLNEQIQTIFDDLGMQVSIRLEEYLLNQHCTNVETIIISGAIPALNAELSRQISSQLNIHSEIIKPLDMFLLADSLNVNSHDLKLAPALGAVLSVSRPIRFSITPFVDISSGSQTRKYKLIAAFSVCIILVLSSYEMVLLHSYKNEYHNLSVSNSELIVWRKRQELITNLEKDIQRRETLLRQLGEQRTAWPQILLSFGYNIPDGVSITSIARVKDNDEYVMRGKAENIEAVSRFIAALQKTGAFRKISLQHIGESSSLSNAGEFLISLKGMGRGYAKNTHTTEQLP